MAGGDPRNGQGRVARATGASSGIGQAIASRLAAAGWRVFGASRSGAPVAVPGVAALLARAGRLDALVNNAGWAPSAWRWASDADRRRARLSQCSRSHCCAWASPPAADFSIQ
jgi:hypothetical protein